MSKKTYVIQENGQITLPIEWRRRHGLKKGDVVVFEETEDGLLISSHESQLRQLLDEIGDALKEKGITLDELIERGREIRQDIHDEKYALDAND
jgi:AbrB family looped-hinge helix DNA binding protein